jgi:hypothetical protein
VTAAALSEPSADPRELAALQRALELVEADRERSLREQRAHYEDSLSWRLTRPLRLANARVRRYRKSPDS